VCHYGRLHLTTGQAAFTSRDAEGNVDNLHPDARRLPAAEFEGDTNPSTGEVGGPKTNPLKWEAEWTYNGRATDF